MRRQTTEELIVGTFFELALTKPVDRITVREICREAGVSTVTFYNHFADKAELMSQAAINLGRVLVGRLGDGYAWGDYLRDVCRANTKAGEVLRNMVRNTDGYQGYSQTMYRLAVDMISARVEEVRGRALDPRESLILRTYLHGLGDSLSDWVMDGMPGDPDEFADALYDAAPEALRETIFL